MLFSLQLKKEFGSSILPPFPPKKLLALNSSQLEERRVMLERYIQISEYWGVCCNGTQPRRLEQSVSGTMEQYQN